MTGIFKIVQQGEAVYVQSQKAECGQVAKRSIVLQELGGKYEDQYAAVMLGNMAQCLYQPGDIVAAALRFAVREYNGAVYQDVVVNEIRKI